MQPRASGLTSLSFFIFEMQTPDSPSCTAVLSEHRHLWAWPRPSALGADLSRVPGLPPAAVSASLPQDGCAPGSGGQVCLTGNVGELMPREQPQPGTDGVGGHVPQLPLHRLPESPLGLVPTGVIHLKTQCLTSPLHCSCFLTSLPKQTICTQILPPGSVSYSAGAAMKKYHRLGGL